MTDTPPAAALACTRLAQGLRELRTRTGLSIAALADRTPYSKSSWERYLNGKQLTPRQGVETLCAIAGEPPGRLVALWELADLEWSGRAGSAAPAVATEETALPVGGGSSAGRAGQGSSRGGRRRWAVAAGACVLGVAVAVWLAVLPDTGARAPEPSGRASHAVPAGPACRARTCTGDDPGVMGCSTPDRVKTLGPAHHTSTGAWLAFRYSAQCRAAWARVWHSNIGDVLEVSVDGGRPQRAEVADGYDAQEYVFTHMVDGMDLTGLRACFEPVGGGHRECFRR